MDRHWWKRFKKRNPTISTSVVSATEAARVNVSQSAVLKYFSEILDCLRTIKSPKQLLNVDEVGLCTRPNKGRKRRVVSSIQRVPTFKEEQDGSHITMTSCVSLFGQSLTPLLLGINAFSCKSSDLYAMTNEFLYLRTKKGRQTKETFIFYCNEVLKPYVQNIRSELKDENAKVFLVLDNASVHEVGSLFDEIGIHPIWLPPHSSHFLQTLDLLLFAELKKAYSSLRTPLTRPKIEGKLLRILRAWNTAKYPLNIINAWKRAGITFRRGAKGSSFEDATFCLDIRRITILIKCNCSDAEKGLDGSWTQEIW